MRVVNADQLRKACAAVRDGWDEKANGPLIYPLACDVIASTPGLAQRIVAALETVTPVGEP